MSVIAVAVRHMLAAGMDADAVANAVEAMEAEIDTRSTGAKRQARYREGGRISQKEWNVLRAKIFARDSFRCAYCGNHTDRPQCDHIIPRSKGGDDGESNLTTSCKPCNSAKRDRTPAEWMR